MKSRESSERKKGTRAYIRSTYDAANQQTQLFDGTTLHTFTYDQAGNQTQAKVGAIWTTARTWDDENRPTRDETKVSIFPATVTTLTYDGSGLLVRRQQGASESKLIWDNQNLLLETDGANATQVMYTLEPLGFGNLVSIRRLVGGNWTRRYYHFNALGTTDRITDDTQTVTDRYQLDPWGKVLATTGTTVNPFRFVGELGYYRYATSILTEASYVRARHYDPNFARWWSQDPLGILGPDGANLYWYVRNRPTWGVDASGDIVSPLPCCNKQPYNASTHCCENGVVVSQVAIWICERQLGSGVLGKIGYWCPTNLLTPKYWDTQHSYVCCDGENLNCFGKQAQDADGNPTKKGDPIGPEVDPTGWCKMKMVCPSTKHSKCNNPIANKDYGVVLPGYENCHDWAWKDVY